MILRHMVLLNTPQGQMVLTPKGVVNEQLDAVINNFISQGVDPKMLKIKTDIELEENEYEIKEVVDN